MPDVTDGLQITGGITKALLDALNQLHSAVAAQLTNPDGSPSGSAVYMHLPIGRSIDPKMYANPWTPAGLVYQASSDDGQFTQPAASDAAPTAPGGVPAPPGQQAAAAQPSAQLATALNSAMNTARLVDDMLMVTDKGIAKSWPDRKVSIEYFEVLTGMQAEPVPEPSDETKASIAAAEQVLYLMDAQGNYTGYTPLYLSYRHNLKALADARTAYAQGYAAAMANPAAGGAWAVASGALQAAVDNAWNDYRDMGGQKIEDAMNTLQSKGGSAVAALIAKARRMFDDYQVGLAGAIAEKIPWSAIDPVSWWDHTDNDFGVFHIDTSSDNYATSSASTSSSFANSFYHDSSSSNSGGAGFSMFGFGASADAGHSDAHHDGQQSDGQQGWQHFQDSSTSASVTFEYFVANCIRDWALLDLLHIPGWYMVGQKQNAISDGTITGQIDAPDRILPMVPKAFLVVRNVTITADNWGAMGDAFQSAADQASQQTDSSSTTFGGSVGWCGIGGHFQHSDSQDSGAFTSHSDASNSWSFTRSEQGGTLSLMGSQIVGWIGEIQPASPAKDDPGLAAAGTPGGSGAASGGASAPAAGTGSAAASGATPAPAPAGAPN
ncbi:hypothetical protein [Microbacterium xylanilyticum]